MIVTTAGRTNDEMIHYAQEVASDIKGRFIMRKEYSIKEIQKKTQQAVVVVGKNRIELYSEEGGDPFFFHPNSSMFRMKRLMKGEHDPFVEATQLTEGMTLLDCTLGMASDSIVASFVVGQTGKVVGLEGNPYTAYIVKKGLQQWDTGIEKCNEALRRTTVLHHDYESYLQSCADNAFDVVYLDPMFEETIDTANGLNSLKKFALYTDVTETIIAEAKRVAKDRIVLKDHFRSQRFQRFGFHVYKRKTAAFHFGTIEISRT